MSISGTGLGQSPPYLQQLAMVEDSSLNGVLTFGGLSPYIGVTDWTLLFENGSWTNLTPDLAHLPPPRYGASMVYDPIDEEAVLFGGCLTSGCYPALNDTWIFANDSWAEISGPSPPARGFAAMAWDSQAGYAVLFGGETGTASSSFSYYGDTWTFVHNHWTNLTGEQVGPQPSARTAAALASSPMSVPVLFGGVSSRGPLDDTWAFSNGNWTNESSGTGPSPRQAAAFAGSPTTGADYLYGGYDAGSYLSDTWRFLDGSWSNLAISGPPGTFGAGFAWDPTSARLILYGGAIDQNGQTGTTNAYWTFSGSSWSIVNPAAPTPFPWIELIPFLILLGILPAEVVILRRRQRRRERELDSLVPDTPPGSVAWYATEPPNLLRRAAGRQMLVMYAIFVPMGLFLSLVFVVGGLNAAALVILAGLWFVFLVLPVLAYRVSSRSATLRVGLFEGGIIVESPVRTRRIPWEYVQPPTQVLKGPSVFFRYSFPGKQSSTTVGGAFAVTRDQARAILAAPRAAGWSVSPPVRTALEIGVGGQGKSGDPTGSGDVPAPLKYTPSPDVHPVDPSIQYRVSTAPLPSAGPPPPPPYPPGPAAQNATGPATAAQLRRCRRCQRLATMRMRYCPNCGAPLN